MVPEYVRTLQDFAKVVHIGKTAESLVLEFKQTIDSWTVPKGTPDKIVAEAQREACRDISQFANTDGGCLLVGVSEQVDSTSGLRVAAGICAVDSPDQLKQWLQQAIRKYLTPATFSHDIVILQHALGPILAINVVPSRHLIALWEPPRLLEYVRRTSHGKDWMNPGEVERHLMNGSRAARLAFELARHEATSDAVQLSGGHWARPSGHGPPNRWTPQGTVAIGRISENWFELRVPTTVSIASVNVPYGVVREAWVGSDGKLNLLLSVQLVLEQHGYSIEAAP